jgi:hypothetical protein
MQPSPTAQAAVGQPSPTAVALPNATALPAATAGAQPAPAQPGAQVLPAPLYFIDEGQIQRLESDGRTRRAVTGEAAPNRSGAIREFDVSPTDGTLAYVLADGSTLVQTDSQGQNRQVLLAMPEAQIGFPRWSPDGRGLAVRLSPRNAGAFPSGVYFVEAARPQPAAPAPQPTPANQIFLPQVAVGGLPRMLVPDDVATVDEKPDALFYAPAQWSPDGNYLLLNGQRQYGNFCIIAVQDFVRSTLTIPRANLPERDDAVTRCNEATWNSNGSNVLLNLQILGLPVTAPGMWRMEPNDKNIIGLLPTEADGQFNVPASAHDGGDGWLYMFLSRTTQQPDPTYSPPLRFSMYRMLAGGGPLEQLRPEQDRLREVLWSRGTSGAAVIKLATTGQTLVWVPTSGPEVLLPASGADLRDLRWGVGQ